MHLRQPGFIYSACGKNAKKEQYKNSTKQETLDILIRTNYIKLALSMKWLKSCRILKIYLKEDLLIKYCVIKHLILPKIQNMMDIKSVLLK